MPANVPRVVHLPPETSNAQDDACRNCWHGERSVDARIAGKIGDCAVSTGTLKPNRRRRRWIIAGILLLVVGVAGWWYWPRGDARFVGTWSATSRKWPSLLPIWTFGPYGRAKLTNRSETVFLRFSWQVRGTTIEFSSLNNKKDFAPWIEREWELLWGKITTGQPDSANEHYEILDASADEITLKNLEDNDQITLRRLK
jgi:hypothetical protein